jgi:5'-nucleotidase / UDP-sugar diphosphatase
MGCDATTFGNHDFDLGPDGTAKSIAAAAKAGHVPAVVASNTDFTANDATLAGLQRLAKDGSVRRYVVIERGGIRFGVFGLLGKEAQLYTDGAGAVTFFDSIEAAREMVKVVSLTGAAASKGYRNSSKDLKHLSISDALGILPT